jgi:hypothetical protein
MTIIQAIVASSCITAAIIITGFDPMIRKQALRLAGWVATGMLIIIGIFPILLLSGVLELLKR